MQTSILDRLTASLCNAVTGQGDGKAMLEALDRGNLFVVPLDDRRRWYRYHHLFGGVVQTRLAVFQVLGFTGSQLSRGNTVGNAPLLVVAASIHGVHSRVSGPAVIHRCQLIVVRARRLFVRHLV